jgi:hypothetical protein
MIEVSQNGWPIIFDRSELRQWNVPTADGNVVLPLRRERAGFVLCHYALWHAEEVEPIFGQGDDFGWALRRIAGSDEWSNHASATAKDLNASRHPSGKRNTYGQRKSAKIRKRLDKRYLNLIKWGGDFRTTVDEMHFELIGTRPEIYSLTDLLVSTRIGQLLIEANPNLGGWAGKS